MKQVVAYVTAHHGYSERRACALTRQHRSTQRKSSIRDPRLKLRQRMREIVQARIRYGYQRVQVMLRREGWTVSKNLVYRLYREEGLVLRSKHPRRRKMVVHREERFKPKRPNEVWALDFIDDQLSNGDKFRALTIVHVFSREAPAIEVGHRLRGEHVVDVMTRLARARDAPKYLFADNGAEFTGHLVDLWPISIRSGLTSRDRASQPTMPSARHSTGPCAMNASTSIGSKRSPKRVDSPRPGGSNTTRAALTWLLEISRQANTLCGQSVRQLDG